MIYHITAFWQNRQWTLLDAACSKCLQNLRTSTTSGQKNKKSNKKYITMETFRQSIANWLCLASPVYIIDNLDVVKGFKASKNKLFLTSFGRSHFQGNLLNF